MKKPLVIATMVVAMGLGIALSLVWLKPKPVELQAMTWLGQQAIPLPPFELKGHNNQAFTHETLKGKWHLLFFGFTNCPDICPESLQMLTNMVNTIDQPSVIDKIQVAFISVDPDRDDLEKIKSYVTYFNPEFLGATGDYDEINKLTDAVGILHYISKSGDTDDYDVAHSGSLILINKEGRFAGVFSSPHDSQKIAQDLTTIIQG